MLIRCVKTLFFFTGFCWLMACGSATDRLPVAADATDEPRPWGNEKANAWYTAQPWITGANFMPSSAINQLEMWQSATFDTATIARELSWAQAIGFNTMRVYLHHKAWEADEDGFLERVNQYLRIASARGIKTIFVIFDDCWNKEAKAGVQPAPKPGIHNSGWLQDPGDPYSKDSTLFPLLEKYVKAVIGNFKSDQRILLWDLYNEPGNSGKGETSMPLLSRVFVWARAAHPTQPVSAALWDWSQENYNRFMIEQSDIITYHNYEAEPWHRRVIETLKTYGKPMICTEYMARTRGSRFATILPLLKAKNVGAINWGLVAGKTNTIYAWDKPMPNGEEPAIWFHDIFRKNGTAFDTAETNLIKSLTALKP
jgi:Cellulase (glycosyl hydrolase family 5)